ncbi:MAG: tetratricopeptide repeat protein [Microthrixaceae bacterium]
MSGTTRVVRLDPDRLAALEEERDHLLASLEDLEREYAAGDLDDADYDTLKDDYTARAAEVLRAIGEQRDLAERARPPRRRGRTMAITAVVLLLAVGAGVLVARSAGQRGGGTLTGNGGTLREELANCQPLAFQEPAKGAACYQKILDRSPDNVEALTYQGWAWIRAGEVAKGGRNLERVVQLQPDYPDARVFRAVVAERAAEAAAARGDAAGARAAFEEAAAEIDRFFRNDPPEVAQQVLAQELLEFKIYLGLTSAPVGRCWASTLGSRGEDLALDQALYDQLGTCLDGVVAAAPDDTSALVARGVAHLGPDRPDPDAALALAERALAVDPQDADALLLRASVEAATGRLDEAERDLAALEGRPRATASFLLGSVTQLREVVQRARTAATAPSTAVPGSSAPTTTPPTGNVSVSTVPGAPAIPNAGGG